MKLFKQTPTIDFVSKFKFFKYISISLVVVSFLAFIILGLNYGVDFSGGTEAQIRFDRNLNTEEIRNALSSFGRISLQKFEGRDDEFLIRMPGVSIIDETEVDSFISSLKSKVAGKAEITKQHFDVDVGDRIELWFDASVDDNVIVEVARKNEVPVTGTVEYSRVGQRHIYKIMLESITNKMINVLNSDLDVETEIQRVDLVGPRVGEKLRQSAFISVIFALMAILIYIALRFNYQFAPGAVAALAHDVLIVLGIFSVFRVPFDLTIVAALLTTVGYSLNDTIVVYDRIRENWNNSKKGANVPEKINTSINETLSRTLLTSVTTLLVLITLLIIGGGIIRGFALAMTLGVFVGTYSSIFVASPVTIAIENYLKKREAR
ncbi:MAG: protein translocase subunit SecF [bacterium]